MYTDDQAAATASRAQAVSEQRATDGRLTHTTDTFFQLLKEPYMYHICYIDERRICYLISHIDVILHIIILYYVYVLERLPWYRQ